MPNVKKVPEISDAQRADAEAQLRYHQREVDYQTKEYIVEVLVKKYLEGIDDDENEIYIPAYQRKFVWSQERQSKFIESVMLGLPVPYIFIASLPKEAEEDEGRAEVVDGSQRIRTLAAFILNELKLIGLEKCDKLNGLHFADLDLSRQRKFNRQSVRVIELSDKADEQIRRDVFERINTGSDELRDMEKRKGIYSGLFYDFIRECASDERFKRLCPISFAKERREEAEELVLRYFAYSDSYMSFKHDVGKFLSGAASMMFATTRLSGENISRIAHLFSRNVYDLPNELRPPCHRDKAHSYASMYGRMRPDAPAQTITSGFGSMGQGRFVHPTRPRMITAREAARIQGFPDYFSFEPSSSRTALHEMIANAVPPALSAAIVSAILAQ